MVIRSLMTSAAALSLAGCATTSFSPPSVNIENEMAVRGSNYSFGQRCQPYERKGDDQNVIPITRNATGARRLIDNFILMYRCRAHSAANGRQMFEVPALLTGIGAATAAAFGAGPDVAIAGGAATAALSAGKSYYDPAAKAEIFDHALGALLCIKTTAAGIDPITLEQMAQLQKDKGLTRAGDGEAISSAEQYFELVTAALFSVERVLAQRLRNVGTFDPAGVVAEIEKLKQEKEQAQAQAAKTAPADATALTTDAPGQAVVSAVVAPAAVGAVKAQIQKTIIQLDTLQPKLQACVVQAKM